VGLAEFINELRAAFSDKHFEEIERIVTEACVVSRFRMTGTHDGSFHGFPPTGKPTEVEGCDLIYIQDGRIVAALTLTI
jgi:predicted ester cyclase